MKNIFITISILLLSQKSFGSFDSYLVVDKKTNLIKIYKERPNFFANSQMIIEPNFQVQLDIPTANSNSKLIGWHLNQIGMSANIEKSSRLNRGIVVAVIDSGIDETHPDLKNHIFINKNEIPNNGIDDDGNGYIDDMSGVNFVSPSSIPHDDNGHGTHVSGIIAGDCNKQVFTCGIIKNVQILPLKFLNKDGRGDTANAIAAIDYAIKMKVDIINASWGNYDYSEALKDAIKRAEDAGIPFVTAAGNYQSDNDLKPMYPANYDLENIFAVAASTEQDKLNEVSNYGQNSVLVAAPGNNIVSTYLNGKYESLSGTSMAAPILTGVIGLYKQYHPQKNFSDFKKQIQNSCEQNINLVDKVNCHGRINLRKLLAN